MRQLTLSTLLLFAALLFSACSDEITNSISDNLLTQEFESLAEKRAPAPGNATIAEFVVDANRFSLLELALEYAELSAVFEGEDQYTLFAPNNEAFGNLVTFLAANFPEWNSDLAAEEGPFVAIDDLLGQGTVANVLLYHVAEGRRAANSVVPKNERIKKDRVIETLLEDATFSVAFGGVITDIFGQEITILDADNSASNGIVHEIDTVMLPL